MSKLGRKGEDALKISSAENARTVSCDLIGRGKRARPGSHLSCAVPGGTVLTTIYLTGEDVIL
jgi:hypothetical protein